MLLWKDLNQREIQVLIKFNFGIRLQLIVVAVVIFICIVAKYTNNKRTSNA
jgi:hypothetical protein